MEAADPFDVDVDGAGTDRLDETATTMKPRTHVTSATAMSHCHHTYAPAAIDTNPTPERTHGGTATSASTSANSTFGVFRQRAP